MADSIALNRLFTRIGEVSTLPSSALRIIAVANDENSSADDLLHLVSSDPALATRLLRTVNSARYALKQRVGDLRSAISLLGFREVRNLAVTVHVSDMFRGGSPYRHYDRQGLWNHMVCVGTLSRMIAHTSGYSRTVEEEAYLAGLLHDVGYVLIDQCLHSHFRQVLDELGDSTTPTPKIEQRILSFDHAQLAGFLAGKWNFPERIRAAIAHHHDPASYEGEHRELVYCVAIANYLATHRGVTALGVRNVPPPNEAVLAGSRLSRSHIESIWQTLDETVEASRMMAAV
ncbi:MAG: HDOD domain-containing protein [Planctomycetales bacterium]|nr:HDOD domain-containing protein [Planctomycetales bacterium]